MALMMYPVGAMTGCEKNCDIIIHNSLNLFQNSSKFQGNVGLNKHYKRSKFEINGNMGRLFVCDLNIFVILCEGEEKNMKKIGQFLGTNILKVLKQFP